MNQRGELTLRLDRAHIRAGAVELAEDLTRPPSRETFPATIGLPPEAALPVAYILSAGLAITRSASGTAFAATMVKHGVITDAQAPQLAEILDDATQHAKQTMDAAELGQAVMPSLGNVRWTVDLRVRFREDLPVLAVPVGIVYIDTDVGVRDLVFQVTPAQCSDLAEMFSVMRARLDSLASRSGKLLE